MWHLAEPQRPFTNAPSLAWPTMDHALSCTAMRIRGVPCTGLDGAGRLQKIPALPPGRNSHRQFAIREHGIPASGAGPRLLIQTCIGDALGFACASGRGAPGCRHKPQRAQGPALPSGNTGLRFGQAIHMGARPLRIQLRRHRDYFQVREIHLIAIRNRRRPRD